MKRRHHTMLRSPRKPLQSLSNVGSKRRVHGIALLYTIQIANISCRLALKGDDQV